MRFRTLKTSEVAELFDITERWINRLSKEKGFPKRSRGKYDLKEICRWLKAYWQAMHAGSKRNDDSLQRSEERKARAQVELLEIKVAQIKGELIPINQIVGQIEPLFGAIRQNLMGIPKAASREFGSKDLETFLDAFIRKSLLELATLDNYDWSTRGTEESAEDVARPIHEAGTEADDQPVGGPHKETKPGGKRRKRPVGHRKSRVPT